MKNISTFITGRWGNRIIKIMVLLLIVAILMPNFLLNIHSIFEKPVIEQVVNGSEDWVSLPSAGEIDQIFTAQSSILSHLSLFLVDNASGEITLTIVDENQNVLGIANVEPSDYPSQTWVTIPVDCENLQPGQCYTLHVQSDDCLYSLGAARTSTAPDEIPVGVLGDGRGSLAVGFSYLHFNRLKWWTKAAQILADCAVVGLLLAVIGFVAFHAEKLLSAFQTGKKTDGFLTALFFALLFTAGTSPVSVHKNQVDIFERVIGHGISFNQDVALRIKAFAMWILSFVLIFAVLYLVLHYLIQKINNEETRKIKNLLGHISVAAVVYLGLKDIVFFEKANNAQMPYGYAEGLLALILGMAVAYIVLDLGRKIKAETFEQLLIVVLCVAVPLAMYLRSGAQGESPLLGIQAALVILVLVLILICKNFWNGEGVAVIVSRITLLFALVPFLTSFFIELIYILNQRGVFVTDPARIYGIAFSIWMISAALIAAFFFRNMSYFSRWKNWAFPVLVAGIACLAVQIPMYTAHIPHIFESANYSVLISDFLNYGKIPLVEHYGGHMMTGVWEGILYYILNKGDIATAALSPYAVYAHVACAVLFYFFVKYLWNEEGAFLTVCFLPYGAAWDYFGIAMLIFLALVFYVRKPTFLWANVFWLACVWATVYRLDLGVSFILASLISVTVLYVIKHDRKSWKPLAVSLLMWVILGTALWCALCVAKDINPIVRLREFIAISSSNANWAYADIGNPGMMAYAWSYLLLPFSVAICLMYLFCTPKCMAQTGDVRWILLAVFGAAYFTNFQRGLVRHSMVEFNFIVLVWSAYVFLAGFVSFAAGKQKVFLPVLTGLIVLQSLLTGPANFHYQPDIESAVIRGSAASKDWNYKRSSDSSMSYWEELKQNQHRVQRVFLDEKTQKLADSYRSVVDTLLDADETYVDYNNATLIYSIIGREVPMYVSQSPLQLSGEYSQEQFIKEIQGIPLVVMPPAFSLGQLDGVPNDYRYYKVAEYIWQNYVPLLHEPNGEFSVWCLRDRYDEMRSKLEVQSVGDWNSVSQVNCGLQVEDETVVVTAEAPDPQLVNLQTLWDAGAAAGRRCWLQISYETDVPGRLQLFYTTEKDEEFSEEKSLSVDMEESGKAVFPVDMTEFTRLRLDTPEASQVTFTGFCVSQYPLVDYNYEAVGGDSAWRQYTLNSLPYLWGEKDVAEAYKNPVVASPEKHGQYFSINCEEYTPAAEGNYIHLRMTYYGTDSPEGLLNREEITTASLSLENIQQADREQKCKFTFTVYEGTHDYLIRASSDYHWYLQDFNAAVVECGSPLHNVQLSILEGD